MTAIAPERLDAFVIARLATAGRRPRLSEIVKPLRRFAPRDQTDAQWRQALAAAIDGLRERGVVDATLRVPPGELVSALRSDVGGSGFPPRGGRVRRTGDYP